jgi:diguanylate cyclase (GGDEF)-like protein
MRLPSFSSSTSFSQQLVLTFTIGIACLALVSSFAASILAGRTIRTQLIEQGLQATETFAAQSTLALLYHSSDNAKEPAKATLAFPDIHGVAIYDLKHQALFSEGKQALPSGGAIEWSQQPKLERETRAFWYFVAPVYTHSGGNAEEPSPFLASPRTPELIGFVRVVMGKETLAAMADQILATDVVVALTLAVLLLLVLLMITARLTNPLRKLAAIMRGATQGEKQMRAELRGPKDILDMEAAFNTMMTVLETREEQLEKARDAALESARIKGEFAANVSHELRTPLSGVLGMLELLHGIGLTPKQREYVDIARDAGESLLGLIDDILDFSRLQSGKLKAQPVDFCLQDLLDDVVGLLTDQARRKHLDLGYRISEEVPARVQGDPSRVRQLLINLVGNAVKFTEHGEVAITVSYMAVQEDRTWLRFEVKDTGIGIPCEAQAYIFEPFSQVDGSTTRKYSGTGLGLAICRQLAEFMGGEIGVDSEPGTGSRFWFTVPFEQARQVPAQDNVYPLGRASDLRFLIVDDSEVNRCFLEQAFTAWGICHKSAASGPQALEVLCVAAAQGEPYDIALIDEELMPAMSGRDLLQAIAHDPLLAPIKVIMMSHQQTSYAGMLIQPPLETDKTPDSNRVAWLAKPLQRTLLYNCITNLANPPEHGSVESIAEPPRPAFHVGGRILLVEDDRTNPVVVAGLLERLGCRIEIAGTGQEALELIAQRPFFDLILMDCYMPELDGYEATRRIRALAADHRQIPIIAMTAHTQIGASEACLAAGMDDYLPKPVRLDALREKLQRWLTPKQDSTPTETAEGPVAREPAAVAALDRTVLTELRNNLREAFSQVIEVFLEDMPSYQSALKTAISEGDARRLTEVAHTLKGSSKTLGANHLVAVSKQLETVGRSGSTEGAMPLFEAFTGEYARVRAALQHELRPDVREPAQKEPAQPRIVIADDDRGVRLALRNVLERDGYQVEEASNGLQALTLCQRRTPDLVLMDARMPALNGFAACRRIHDLPDSAHLPIVMITALDDEQSIEQAFAAGANDYIPKPVNFAVLRQRVARIVDASRAEKHVHQLAYRDPLTDLANRTAFRERLDGLLSRGCQEGQSHALLFLDLDRFKLVNDTLGHETGDRLLKTVAERVAGCVRADDMVSRLGGDEFIVMLENINSPMVATLVAEKICHVIARPFVLLGRQIYLSTSIGIALYPADSQDGGTLIKYADMAMFRAKEHGNTYRFYEPSMEAAVLQKLDLESGLRRALDRDELVLHYQPRVDLRSGKIVSMEGLIRWQHPQLGLVSPAQFIPLAEETGLIEPIGAWVLRTACAQNKAWQDEGLARIPVAVNLSARQLRQGTIEDSILKVLADTGLDPAYLDLELTESMIMKEPGEMRRILRRLKDIGVLLSIDDFGTGYSSLNHLKYFSFDTLKIDQSFVRDLIINPSDAMIVLAIIAMARSFRIRVVAEGVETEAQLRYLQQNGCDEIQGYYVSRPVPSDEAGRLLREDRPLL